MSKWWYSCEACGLGLPEDEPRIPIKDCEHLIWSFGKKEEEEKMSRYHSICETCGMEDPNDGSLEQDCGHPFWAIVEHEEVTPNDKETLHMD